MASLRSLTLNGVKWYLIGDSVIIAFNFVIGIILARLLTPEDFGIIGVYGIFFALAEIFINGGFSMSLIQKKDMSDLDCSTAFWANIIVGIFFNIRVIFTINCFVLQYSCVNRHHSCVCNRFVNRFIHGSANNAIYQASRV